jgi:hypothetical protein
MVMRCLTTTTKESTASIKFEDRGVDTRCEGHKSKSSKLIHETLPFLVIVGPMR